MICFKPLKALKLKPRVSIWQHCSTIQRLVSMNGTSNLRPYFSLNHRGAGRPAWLRHGVTVYNMTKRQIRRCPGARCSHSHGCSLNLAGARGQLARPRSEFSSAAPPRAQIEHAEQTRPARVRLWVRPSAVYLGSSAMSAATSRPASARPCRVATPTPA